MAESTPDPDESIDNIVVDRFGVNRDAFDDATRFDGEVLDADSLDVVELAEAIDANLGVFVPDEDLEKMETIDDVKGYVRDAV